MKKIITIIVVVFMTVTAFCQPSQPPKPNGDGSHPDSPTSSGTKREQSPIGTATALMLGLGACTVAYKLKKKE